MRMTMVQAVQPWAFSYGLQHFSLKSVAKSEKKTGYRMIPRLTLDMAEWTGLEPATPGVTGQYSNQLNYHSRFLVGAAGIEPATLAL